MLELREYLKIFIGLIAIVNPIGVIPIFISLTLGQKLNERRNVANTAALATGLILLVTLFMGEEVLVFFGITINSFRVGGGILILLMSISMLNAKVSTVSHTPKEATESKEKETIGVVPLATPLLAGPGAISTVVLDAHKGTGIAHYLIISFEIVLLSVIIWIIFRLARFIEERIGTIGINIIMRIMGLLLAAIAVEFIANGLKGLFLSSA